MRAAVITGVDVVSIETVDDPTPGPGEVVVEVAGCGLCGTDLHILHGHFAPSLPVIPGHEFAGTIVAVGPGVERRSVGERVAVDPSLYCFRCHYCRIGRNNLCEKWAAIGVSTSGGAAQFATAPEANCVPVPDSISLADAALIEPLSCAVRGYDVLGNNLGAHVLIYGAGTMGLMMLQLAKRVGAASVEMVDLNDDKLGIAQRLGCSGTANGADEYDRDRGWELVVDATGNPRAIQDAVGRVAPGGTFLQFGVAPADARVEIDPYWIYNKEITITGSMAVLHSYERAADLFATGVLDPDVFITDRLPLDDYRAALDNFAAGKGLKTQVQP